MARIRSIKPEFWTSAQVMDCSPMARLLFVGMWNFADDAGRLAYSPKTLKAQIYPSDDIKIAAVSGMIDELSTNGLILIYVVDDKQYISISGWSHQKIDKPKPSKLPSPFDDKSTTVRRKVAPDLILPDPIRSEDSEANASGAEAPDPRTRLFREGLAKIAAMTGKGQDSCRTFVGKCLKEASDDASVVLGLIEDAERNRVVDPGSWISARLKGSRNGTQAGNAIIRAADNLVARTIAGFDGPKRGAGELRNIEGETSPRLLSHR